MEQKLVLEDHILNDILTTCKKLFGFHVIEAMSVKRGWLNLKWRIRTENGLFFIKQYNKERYKLYHRDELLFAFSQQMRLYHHGVPCPKLLSIEEHFLFESDHGELFIVMEYCEGDIIPPGKLDREQMFDLGKVTGRIHQLLNDGELLHKMQPEFMPPSREERLEYWEAIKKRSVNTNQTHLRSIIDLQS